MPNRVVRGEILRSERYHEVGETARLLFFELLLVADDYGLLHLAPVALRMSCPSALNRTYDQMTKLMAELHDADLIRVYEVKGARYGFIPRFGNYPKARKPKYPLPGDSASLKEINELVSKRQSRVTPDAPPMQSRGTASEHETETETETETEERERGGREAPARSPRASRKCPGSFVVTDAMKAWAVEKAPDADLTKETATFRDHTFKTAMTDWEGAWRNWMRKAQTWLEERNGGRRESRRRLEV